MDYRTEPLTRYLDDAAAAQPTPGGGSVAAVAGALADRMGSFGPAFLLAAGVALVGGVASLMLRPQCDVAVA